MQINADFLHIFLLHLFFTFFIPLILQGLEAILLFLSRSSKEASLVPYLHSRLYYIIDFIFFEIRITLLTKTFLKLWKN